MPHTQLYVSGPAVTWIGTTNFWGNGGDYADYNDWEFFGFSQRGWTITFTPMIEPLEADYAGNMPADLAVLGYEARISGTLARFNDRTAQKVASFGTGEYGFMTNTLLGTLMQQEQFTYPVLIQCPYGAKPVFHLPGQELVGGFLFYSVVLDQPYEFLASIRHKTPSVSWRAVPMFGAFDGTGHFFKDIYALDATPTQTESGAPYTANQLYGVMNWDAVWPDVN